MIRPLRRRAIAAALTLATALVLTAQAAVALPARTSHSRPAQGAFAATSIADPSPDGRPGHGVIPEQFVGLSIEWSLVERYMGPVARPAFVNLLRNLGGGVLRIGGSSQDVMPFEPNSPNTNQIITPEDLQFIKATVDAVNTPAGEGETRSAASDGAGPGGTRSLTDAPAAGGSGTAVRARWQVVLGTAMAPPKETRPFVSPQHARTFAVAVKETFRPGQVLGVELGNEPDLSYGTAGLSSYLTDLPAYTEAVSPLPVVAPNTSEDILPWQSIDGRTVPTRWFWNWPQILDNHPAYGSDHFYPLARTCVNKPYRCPSIPALLSDQHLQSLDYQVDEHARAAAERSLPYRLEETNTAAGRGADGVSNVAASAAYALDMMFHVACPQSPKTPGANLDCKIGGVGVNLHNAEVRAFFEPQEGNGYYNAIDYDPTAAMGAPTAAPEYYALLFFGRFAQGLRGLRPLDTGTPVKGWRTDNRLFLINKTDQPISVPVPRGFVDRMTPYDGTGAGRSLDATQVRIDGRQTRTDGSWPGFRPQRLHQDQLRLAPGEAAVISKSFPA